jgi:hypothetical protein
MAPHGLDVWTLEFDPGSPYVPLPDVAAVDPHAIEISVASVSSTFFSSRQLAGMSIRYRIGQIVYPGAHDPKPSCDLGDSPLETRYKNGFARRLAHGPHCQPQRFRE